MGVKKTESTLKGKKLAGVACLISACHAVGGLLKLGGGRWPAYLDLSPIKNGWPLVGGGDDGTPESPMFHAVLWLVSELFGSGGGVVIIAFLSMLTLFMGAGKFYSALNVNPVVAMVLLAGSSFVLTRHSVGQLAFLAGIGVTLFAASLQIRRSLNVELILLFTVAAMLSPHAGIIGLLFSACVGTGRIRRTAYASVGVAAAVWPVVVFGYGRIGDLNSFEATRPWYEAVLIQTGFWHGDEATIISILSLAAVSVAVFFKKVGPTPLISLWAASCGVYLTLRTSKAADVFDQVLSFARDEHKVLIGASVALAGGAAAILPKAAKYSAAVACVTLMTVTAWSVGNQTSFTQEESQALRELSAKTEGVVAVWPSYRYNRLSEGGVLTQDGVSRMLEGATRDMGEDGARRGLSEWISSGGETDYEPYFDTLVIIKYGQQGYGWLDSQSERVKLKTPAQKYFDVYYFNKGIAQATGRETLTVIYYALAFSLSFAAYLYSLRRRHSRSGGPQRQTPVL